MYHLSNYIDELADRGKYYFTTQDAQKNLGTSIAATKISLYRMKKAGKIASPYKNFFLIIRPSYRKVGCLMAQEYIPMLMRHMGIKYYLGLNSAASYFGAQHHYIHKNKVIVEKPLNTITCGEIVVEFIVKKNIDEIKTTEWQTDYGKCIVSTPEETAFDLIGYFKRCGGLDIVATTYADLAEEIDEYKLVEAAKHSPIVWTQRLGYLFDLVDAAKFTNQLAKYVEQNARNYTRLHTQIPDKGTKKSKKWKLYINSDVDPDTYYHDPDEDELYDQ
jgi:predicted transcriptional regulator of viral defense system